MLEDDFPEGLVGLIDVLIDHPDGFLDSKAGHGRVQEVAQGIGLVERPIRRVAVPQRCR